MAAAAYKFGASRRLRTPAQYAAVSQAPRARSIRAARTILSINAAWVVQAAVTPDASAPSVRFGITVGKRFVRRAVDRVLVKRLVREACRLRAHAFEYWAASAKVNVDVALRLKAFGASPALAMSQWRRQVRSEADELLLYVLNELTARLCAPSRGSVNK